MDITDVKILELLQENSRISISEISKKVNMSLSAVSERHKKLESTDIIEKYTVILNPQYLGKELSVLMNLCLEQSRGVEEFNEFIKSEPEILECHYITVEYDVSLKIVTKNTATLEKLMNRIKTYPGIKRSQTNVILSSLKNKCSVSPNVCDNV